MVVVQFEVFGPDHIAEVLINEVETGFFGFGQQDVHPEPVFVGFFFALTDTTGFVNYHGQVFRGHAVKVNNCASDSHVFLPLFLSLGTLL